MMTDAETKQLYREIGERLVLARGLLTQAEFGEKIGYPGGAIGKCERGQRAIDPEMLNRIATVYNVNVNWLVSGIGPMHVPRGGTGSLETSNSALSGTNDSRPAEGTTIPYDPELMGRITSAIAKLYRAERVSLPDVDLGRLAMQGYAEIVETADDPEEYPARIELMVVRLRKALRAAAASPETSKRRA